MNVTRGKYAQKLRFGEIVCVNVTRGNMHRSFELEKLFI
jgi:hypothetical protein